ncbi:MAG: hypothetical protein SFZ23_15245 [Planctomycetota bacterium]|nr:hypothetical protein [Planctomycetota bacterium]
MKSIVIATLAGLAAGASAQTCATPVIQPGNDPFTNQPFQGPGPCPAGVTAANFQVSLRVGTVLGANDDTGDQALKVFPIRSGPLTWTSGWTNEGDIDANISPVEPSNPLSYPPDAFIRLRDGNGLPNGGGLRTYAWAINQYEGSVMMSVRVNGRDNQDVLFVGGPSIGTLHGLVNVSADTFRSGRAYDMNDGTHRNGNGSMYLSMHYAGTFGNQEMNFDCGAAWFPYDQGWVAGYVSRTIGSEGEASFLTDGTKVARSDAAANAEVFWNLSGGNAPQLSVRIPGVNANTDGILLAQPYQDSNDPAFVSVTSDTSNAFQLTYRLTRLDAFSEIQPNANCRFHFVYVPFCAENLVAAKARVLDGRLSINGSAGDFTLVRTGTGTYRLSIPGKSDATGTLILQSMGEDSDTAPAGSRRFLSYAPSGNDFIIEARYLTTGNNIFGEDAVLGDTDFAFVYIDHTNPIAPCNDECAGADFNGDSQVDFFDYLDFASAFGNEEPAADFNSDGQVDFFDYLDFASAFGNCS